MKTRFHFVSKRTLNFVEIMQIPTGDECRKWNNFVNDSITKINFSMQSCLQGTESAPNHSYNHYVDNKIWQNKKLEYRSIEVPGAVMRYIVNGTIYVLNQTVEKVGRPETCAKFETLWLRVLNSFLNSHCF